MQNPFTAHPRENGMTYWQHFWMAIGYGGITLLLSIIIILHAIFPFIFVTTFGDKIRYLAQHFEDRMEVEGKVKK